MFTACGIVRALYHKLQTHSSAPEDGRNYRPKQVELIEIINKPLLLHLVGYLYYWQIGFNSVYKGLNLPNLVVTAYTTCFKIKDFSGVYVFRMLFPAISNSPLNNTKLVKG